MAKQFGSQIDLQKIPVLGIVAEQKATAPTSPVNGQLWYDTTNNVAKVYENGSWNNFVQTGLAPTGGAGGDLTGNYPNPTITTGAVTTAKILDGTILLTDMDPTASNAAAATPSLRKIGTGATDAAAGNDSRLSDSRAPNGTATGDLSGSYPNPTVASLAITAGKIANATITDVQVAAANKDGVAGTASLRTLGTGATQAAAGNDARFTDSRAPSGAAGGDLTGSTYPNPVIANLAVTAAKIANATITDTQVAAANKDGVVGTASMRTIGTGALQALAGNTRLDTIAAPTASVNLNNQKISGLADGASATDAVTKQQLDAVSLGLDVKASVRIASTANLGLTGLAAIDGVTPVNGDRVLVKDQTTQSANGIYTAASGAWTRATDFDTSGEASPGTFTFVEEGTTQADTGWVMTANAPITLGTTALTWAQFSGAGSIVDGIGLLKTGNTLDVRVDNSSIEAPADILQVKALGITNAMLAGSIDLTTKVTNTLPTARGGTGIATNPTQGGLAFGASTTTQGYGAAGTAGNVAISGGTGAPTWAAANSALVGLGNVDNTSDVNKPVSTATTTALAGKAGKFSGLVGALVAGVETLVTHSLGSQYVVASFLDASTNNAIDFTWRAASTTQIGITADVAYSANAVRAVVVG